MEIFFNNNFVFLYMFYLCFACGVGALLIIVFLGGDVEWRNSFSEREPCTIKKSKTG